MQSEQGASVVDSIATMASCAESRGTLVVVPSCHATSPSGGASSGQRAIGRDHPGHERALVVVAHGLLPVADLARQLADRGDRSVLTGGGHRLRPRREHRLRPLMGSGRVGGPGREGASRHGHREPAAREA